MPAPTPFQKNALTLAIHACCYSLLGAVPMAHAAPVGGEVVGGSGVITQSGLTTTINQASQNLATNWQSFDVNRNERVQFIQPNATSIALNRILSNNGSTIAGRIDANGQVILVNPNGVFFTPTASLNVGSLIASGLDITPNDFMNGNYIFNAIAATNGQVINSGMITASLGGNVALLGKQVQNTGLIAATLGSVTLAAGKQAVLTFDNGGLLGVRVSEAVLQKDIGVDPAVINSGTIQAQGGRVLLTASVSQDIFSKAVNTNGVEPATSVTANPDGTFTLGSGVDVANSGSIDTAATDVNQNGGQIVLLGQNVTSSGTLNADAANGHGGEIELQAQDTTLLTQHSVTSARAETNGQGGIVKVLGDKVGLFDQSSVDVSGAQGGGQALIGGDLHGANASIRNASSTVVSPGAAIYADALHNGNSGQVIIWSDANTWYFGNIFARGGSFSGNGGFVETSGKINLLFDGAADRSAINGSNGTLLLDPKDINIANGNSSSTTQDNSYLSTASSTPSVLFQTNPNPNTNITITNGRIVAALSSGNVLLQATRDIYTDTNASIAANSGNTNSLELEAGNAIQINSSINLRGGALTLTSGRKDCATGAVTGCAAPSARLTGRSIEINGAINTTGTVILNAADNVTINDTIGATNRPSALTIRAGNNITLDATGGNNGAINTNGAVSLTAADGSLVTSALTVAPNATPAGIIAVYGNVTTNNNDFTATTTAGYFQSLASGFSINSGTINSGTGKVSVIADGNDAGNYNATIFSGAVLGKITAGTLDVTTTSGQIVQTTANDTNLNLNIANATTFNAGNNPIDLQNAANSLTGTVSLTTTGTGNNATLWNSATNTILGAINVSGNLDIHASRNLHVLNTPITSGGDMTLTFGTQGSGSYTFCYQTGGACAGTAVLTGPTLNSTGGNLAILGGTGNDTFNLAGLTLTAPTAGKTATLDGLSGTDTVIGQNSTTAWTIVAPNKGTLGTVGFDRMEALIGGSGDDTFTYYVNPNTAGLTIDGGTQATRDVVALAAGAGISGFTVNVGDYSNIERFQGNGNNNTLQGATGGTNTWSITGVNSGTVNGVEFLDFPALLGGGVLGAGNTTDLFTLVGAGSITGAGIDGNGGNDTLTGPDAVNYWTISGINSGSINATSFTKIQTLTGGNTTDNFLFNGTGSISGLINGGDGSDTLDRTALTSDVTVQLLHGNTPTLNNLATINTTNVESINANTGNTVTNTLIGDNTVNTWTLTGTNAGNVDSVSPNPLVYFTGFKNLTGGGLDDTFVYQPSGKVTGLIDGKGGTNTVDLSALATVNVSLTNGIAGVLNISEVIGNNTNSTLTGDNSGDTWTISGANSGSVAGTTSLTFRRFNNLVGGTGGDTYNITSNAGNTTYGSISGNITDNAGANHLNADITHVNALAADGQVVYVGGGTDTVLVTGTAPTGWSGSYTPTVAPGRDQIAYTNNTSTFAVNYQGVGSVSDTATVANYRINGTSVADIMTLGANTVQVNGALGLAFSNKQNMILDGGTGVDTLLQQSNTTLTLPSLTLANIENVNNGSALTTDIGNLSVINSGPVTVNEANALTLGPINTASLIDITAGGAVGSSAALVSTAPLTIQSAGDITLSDAGNGLSGPLTLMAPSANNITLNNTTATTLAGLNANNLAITSTGNITNTGPVVVANAFTLQTPGSITLNNLDHITTGSMTAAEITLNTLNGIGTVGSGSYINPAKVLNTATAKLNITNQSGNVFIANQGTLDVNIVTQGDINLQNNASITVRQLYADGVSQTPANNLGGNIYLSTVDLSTVNGSVYGNPDIKTVDYLVTPGIVAQNFTGILGGNPRDMGQVGLPISAFVKDEFLLYADNAYIHFFLPKPINLQLHATLFEYSDFAGINELLINVESLGDFDPAIFTAVRNYYYEDVAILMPADQRLNAQDDDENDSDKKKEKEEGTTQ